MDNTDRFCVGGLIAGLIALHIVSFFQYEEIKNRLSHAEVEQIVAKARSTNDCKN